MELETRETDDTDLWTVLEQIRARAAAENVRITQHAQQEMVEEDIALDEVLEAISTGEILENYPQHRRGPCCLPMISPPKAVLCTTTTRPLLIIITVYEPKPLKWVMPTQRRRRE